MGLLSFWNQRKAEKRAAKTRSDEIDLNILEQRLKSSKQVCDVLLISIPKSKAAASAFIERTKLLYDVPRLLPKEIFPVTFDRPTRFSVDDTTAHFSAEAQRTRTVAKEYDILYCADDAERGIKETYFTGVRTSIRVLQVCGQGGERKKWIHLFGSIECIIFYASLSDYDERVDGQSKQTRLEESLNLFDSVAMLRLFLQTSESIIVFLTDKAEFGTKIHEVPLAQYYPEYTGGTDADEGAKYILRRFERCIPRHDPQLYIHITEDSDPSNLRMIFSSVEDTLLRNHLKEAGLL